MLNSTADTSYTPSQPPLTGLVTETAQPSTVAEYKTIRRNGSVVPSSR